MSFVWSRCLVRLARIQSAVLLGAFPPPPPPLSQKSSETWRGDHNSTSWAFEEDSAPRGLCERQFKTEQFQSIETRLSPGTDDNMHGGFPWWGWLELGKGWLFCCGIRAWFTLVTWTLRVTALLAVVTPWCSMSSHCSLSLHNVFCTFRHSNSMRQLLYWYIARWQENKNI